MATADQMKKRYKVIPGYTVNRIANEIIKKDNSRTKKDTDNRYYVIEKMQEYMEKRINNRRSS